MADNEKIIPSRVTLKHDTEAKWADKKDFIPLKSEMIVYDEDDTHNYKRIKLGDGVTTVVNLPFATISNTELTERLSVLQEQIDKNELQVSETKPTFACTWFHVTSNT